MGKERIAVLGGKGMVGRELLAQLAAAGTPASVHDLPECDLTKSSDLAAALRGATVILNCAAFTNVDGAEEHADLAAAVNGRAVGELGRLAAAQDAYVLHLSTDFVFDGRKPGAYDETDAPAPVSAYGRTKLEGERQLQASGCRHAILRLQWVYGRYGQNFITKIRARAEAGGPLRVVDDQWGAPTGAPAIAQAMRAVAAAQTTGLYHFAAQGYASRFEIARFIVAALGLGVEVLPCRTADFPTPAERPLNSRFNCARFDALLPGLRPDWRDALALFLEQTR